MRFWLSVHLVANYTLKLKPFLINFFVDITIVSWLTSKNKCKFPKVKMIFQLHFKLNCDQNEKGSLHHFAAKLKFWWFCTTSCQLSWQIWEAVNSFFMCECFACLIGIEWQFLQHVTNFWTHVRVCCVDYDTLSICWNMRLTWLCQDWWQWWRDARFPPDNRDLVDQPGIFSVNVSI